ncbi:hypothetical protein [Aestuariicoccus sp. MJ-SS9]|uniref:hypothetical protein n=1 Tax=Aestuariicoccus sp. MJ-SS9 TaxID=3079855 RepID=UPI002913F3D6|nr:hypothetical protein [Aestuariicoccus sp. MJ-SS9]MDU8913020.1 hypothetical protein [Aestuariicoccus sp. MJ-SS9]
MACLAGPLAAQNPLSAIDWLEAQRVAPRAPGLLPPADEPAVARTALRPEVETLPLDAPTVEGVGLLPQSVTGLPRSLWARSDARILATLIRQTDPAVPALSALFNTLLLAEADPARDPGGETSLLAARTDALMQRGVVEPALALIERAGPADPALWPYWFELGLLTGDTSAACAALRRDPGLGGDLRARIWCSAREGDWGYAATLLQTGAALGSIRARDADLLQRFLDPELAEDLPYLRPPVRPDALQFRLFEAIGEPLPTAPLPRRFASVDLGGDSGWKAQLEAGERLARTGAISENRLLGLYSARKPAASGGIWDRVAALQAFEAALGSGDPARIGPALETVWPQMRSAGLLVAFSELSGPALIPVSLEGRAADLAQRAALLSSEYEAAAARMTDQPLLQAVAQGRAPETAGTLPHAGAVAAAFGGAAVPSYLQDMLGDGRLGEAILEAIALFSSGAEGNPGDLTAALAVLRAVGLEDPARRAALQVMLLDDEGARR